MQINLESPKDLNLNINEIIPEIELADCDTQHCGTSTSSGLSMEFFVSISDNQWNN